MRVAIVAKVDRKKKKATADGGKSENVCSTANAFSVLSLSLFHPARALACARVREGERRAARSKAERGDDTEL